MPLHEVVKNFGLDDAEAKRLRARSVLTDPTEEMAAVDALPPKLRAHVTQVARYRWAAVTILKAYTETCKDQALFSDPEQVEQNLIAWLIAKEKQMLENASAANL